MSPPPPRHSTASTHRPQAAAGAGAGALQVPPPAHWSVASPQQTPRAAAAAAAASGTSDSLSPMSAAAHPAQSASVAPYRALGDLTLTAAKAREGGFRTQATANVIAGKKIAAQHFRVPSNPTKAKHKSGYHEATVTTDMAVFLSHRTVGRIESTLPVNTGNSALRDYSRATIFEANVRPLMEAGDGARPDTARTFLSVPGGTAAGHSGSGTDTTGQAAAHDFLRVQGMHMLQAPIMTPGIAGVASAALMVMSMAPGQYASTVANAGKLKDRAALQNYEGDRNAAKLDVRHYFMRLPANERHEVMRHARQAMTDLNDNQRQLLPDAPYSPMRDSARPAGAAVAGGGYLPSHPALPPLLALPPPAAAAASAAVSRSASITQRHTPQAAAASAASPSAATAAAAMAATPPHGAGQATGGKRRFADSPPAAAGSGAGSSARTAAIHAHPQAPATPAAAAAARPSNKRARTQSPAFAAAAAAAAASPASPQALSPLLSPRSINLAVSTHFRARRR